MQRKKGDACLLEVNDIQSMREFFCTYANSSEDLLEQDSNLDAELKWANWQLDNFDRCT